MVKHWWWIPIILITSVTVIAQESTCAQLLRNTFDVVAEVCSPQVENMLCHGNPTLSVTVNDTIDETIEFSDPGDILPITAIDTLSTSTIDGTWGSTRLHLRAYPSNNMNPKPASMVVLGDVTIQNNGTENITISTIELTVTESQGANLRSLPSTDARLVTSQILGTILKASGKSADDLWIRVHPSPDEVAWVSSTVVSDGYNDLPVVTPDDTVDELILPMESFDFESGSRLANCGNSGLSGILLQSNATESSPVFIVNDVLIELNGTVFLQADAETGMLISVVDGRATVTAIGETLSINEGYVSRILMETDEDDRIIPAEPAAEPLVYDYDMMLSLPLDLLSENTSLGIDIYTLVTPRPSNGESPIAGMALDAPCKFTVGQSGANIRSKPGTDGSIIAAMAYRESAEPIARAIGSDGLPWWKLAESVWIRVDTTVTGGDCTTVPLVQFEG